MIRAIFFVSVLTPLVLATPAFAKTLTYKAAKAECLKENPELKGKPLRTCANEKTKSQTPSANSGSSNEATSQ